MEILLSLLSGFIGSIIGAVIGGLLSYKGAVNAAKKQIDSLYAQEKESRTYAEKQQVEAMTSALATEIEENIYLATNLRSGYSTSLLSTEAWTIYKGNLRALSSSLQLKLLNAYTEIRRFNTLVEYDRLKIAAGNGMMDGTIREHAKKMIDICKAVKEEITIS